MSVAHEAGALHGAPPRPGPAWLAAPDHPDTLVAGLWSQSTDKDDDGVLRVAGVRVTDIAERFGTPAYVLDVADFRARLAAYRDAFAAAFAPSRGLAGAEIFYAGKAFLCVAAARWVAEAGVGLDVCTGGELAVALRAGFPVDRLELHGNNKSVQEIDRAVRAGVATIVLDAAEEIGRVAAAARRAGRRVDVLVRVTVGVEAHTHSYIATAHEDQKFGFGLADGSADRAVEAVLSHPELRLTGLHSHIGSQIFDTGGFAVSAARLIGLRARLLTGHASALPDGLPHLGLGGGFGMAYTTADDPADPAELARQMADVVARECAAHGTSVPTVSVEPGRAVAGPSTHTLYTVGTVKQVPLDGGHRRAYVAVDGGMSDNVRPALYGAPYSATRANRTSAAASALSRVVGKHCESGDVVVWDEYLPADMTPGDLVAVPGTGAYCRSMSSQYNHVPRPPVLAVEDGVVRPVVRRETEDDLLALELD